MAEILLKPSEARGHAGRMSTAAEEARSTFDNLRAELNALAESFRGQAQVAFDEKYNEWNTGANQVVESLEGLSGWLNQAADTLEDVDSQIASQLRG